MTLLPLKVHRTLVRSYVHIVFALVVVPKHWAVNKCRVDSTPGNVGANGSDMTPASTPASVLGIFDKVRLDYYRISRASRKQNVISNPDELQPLILSLSRLAERHHTLGLLFLLPVPQYCTSYLHFLVQLAWTTILVVWHVTYSIKPPQVENKSTGNLKTT